MATPEASRTLSLTTSLLALSPVLAVSPALAQSLPSGGTVTAGNATIETSGSSLIVSQSSQNAIIAWESFSVGSGATAHFENGAGATLNRVRGRLPSTIDGLLTASGSVYLVNPAGVTVGSGGVVRTGGSFVASTLDVTDEDFLDGGALTLTGGSAAAVINLGSIASAGGDVVLTARRVENAGSIEAPAGSAGLLAGYEVELRDMSLADGKLAVRVGGSNTEVVNAGTLRAADAELRANGGHVQALAGNTEAIIKATGVEKSGGRIFLTAGEGGTVEATQRMQARRAATPEAQPAVATLPEAGSLPAAGPDLAGGEVHVSGGTVTLAGAIDAAGAGDAGGTITAVGKDRLDVLSTAVLDASGSDGGTVLLGGDYQGGQDASSRYLDRAIGTAAATAVADGALIRADGTKGAGGNVVIWSDGTTTFDGEVSAVGVTAGGDAEVSGKALLGFTGTVDLRATAGEAGTLLLDPYNVTISTEADGSTTGNDSVINVSTLTNALQAASVVVGTGTGGAQDGNITVDAEIAWGAGTRLTLDAANNITVNAPIRMEGTFASLVLDASNGELTINAPIVQERSNQLVSLLASSHTLYTNPFLNLHFGEEGAIEFGRADQGGRLSINGTEYTLVYSMEQLDAIDGVNGVTGANVATYGPGLGGAYALARDLDAAGTTYTRALIGTNATEDAGSRFAGTLEGLGHVITNLTIDAPSLDYVGLIGYASDLTVRNIGLERGSVSGNQYVAGIVGRINAGTIQQTYSTLDVTANEIAGGLVGIVGHVDADADPTAYASIVASHATGDVTGSRTLGGLLGGAILQSIIADSYATGDVRGTDYVGGLAGAGSLISHSYATGDVQATGAQVGGLAGLAKQITHSYATGDVSGAGFVGGLVGFVDLGGVEDSYATGKVTGKGDGTGGLVGATLLGPISRSYATGDVSGRGVGTGGLVGESNGGSVSQSYATGDVVGEGDMTGGLVGAMLGGGISQSYATGSVHGGGSGTGGLAGGASSVSQSYATGAVYGDDTVGGLVGALGGGGSISESYATGAVHGSSTVGGLAGGVLAGTVTDSYWDTYTTGQPGAFGVFLSGSADSVSAITSDPSQSGAANYAYKQGAYSGFTFTATPGAGDWYMIEGETRPFGAWEYSTDIVNAHQLQLMAMDLGADYTLLADIDLGAALAGVDYGTGGAADIRRPGMWGGRGFMPVGGSVSLGVPFSGTFDGQGHVVSGLTIDRSTDDFVGLFGLAVDAAIRDVGLVDARIRGRFGSGALVGRMDRTTVTRSYATGMVTGTEMVGGLVGQADFFSTITRSYFSGSVAGGEFVGGLAGMVGESSQVSQSYTTGAVSGVNRVGGLVGLLGSSFTPPEVRQSYSTSAVKGTSFVGGLVGEVSIGVIGEAYASGAVVGDDYVGGLIGSLSGFVTDSYWDVETTGQSEGAVVGSGSFSATGLTTHDLQAALPTDFDASVWGIVPSVSNPYLRWRFPNGPTVISGTAHDIAGGVGSLEVGVAVNGTLAGSIYTGTNGYYNVMLDPVEAGSAVVTWLTGTRHGMGTTTSRANAVAELASSVP
ncbi:MAG TPA: filamentous hemagglutinin N-terminal domain-containing protein, partial [Gammaproteobacteria bacterium]